MEKTEGKVESILKKLASLLLTLALMASLTVPALAAGFTDVSSSSPFAAAIGWAVEKGITNGTTPTTFGPGNTCTTSHILTFLWRANGRPGDAGNERAAVTAWAGGLGIDASDLSAPCTRAAAVTYIWKAAGSPAPKSDADFSDVPAAADYAQAVAWAVEKGVTNGAGNGGFSPDAICTRGQIVTFLYRAMEGAAPAETPSSSAGVSAVGSGVAYEIKSVAGITAHVLTVDTKNPRVHVKTAMVNNTVGATAPFKDIVQSSGAYAAVNGNFFASYSDFKAPIGHVMVDGEFLYGNSGVSSLGITKDGELRVGRPALFTRIKAANTSWTAYEINTLSADGSVLYTPAFGSSVTLRGGGSVMTVSGGTVTGFRSVSAGETVAIPAGGYVVYMDSSFTSTSYFRTPQEGTSVSVEYYLHQEDPEGFTLDDVVSVVSGAPRLVQDGAIVTTLEAGFTEERFTVNSSPRTAIGVNGQGKLVLVSTPAATIQQMREAMLALGCVDAFNLDGGASCGMYYDGNYLATPGRELTVTLQVFVDS